MSYKDVKGNEVIAGNKTIPPLKFEVFFLICNEILTEVAVINLNTLVTDEPKREPHHYSLCGISSHSCNTGFPQRPGPVP